MKTTVEIWTLITEETFHTLAEREDAVRHAIDGGYVVELPNRMYAVAACMGDGPAHDHAFATVQMVDMTAEQTAQQRPHAKA